MQLFPIHLTAWLNAARRSSLFIAAGIILAMLTPGIDAAEDSGQPNPPPKATSGIVFRIEIADPDGRLKEFGPAFKENLQAAADLWGEQLEGQASINVRVNLVSAPGRAISRAPTTVLIKKIGKNSLQETSVSAKLNGRYNGDRTDIEITVSADYLKDFWFDPAPRQRIEPLPVRKFDAVSLFLHELAHGIGMNGWLDVETGDLAGNDVSTYDRFVIYADGRFYFVGLEAMKVFGGPVPLSRTTNNYHHVGQKDRGKANELKDDLMCGVVFQRGQRFAISPLDLAIMADCGIPVKREKRPTETLAVRP